MQYKANVNYKIVYITKTGQEKEIDFTPEKDMNIAELITTIKSNNEDFFKLKSANEIKGDENMEENKEVVTESEEMLTNLYDVLEARNFEDVDITDKEIDIMVAYSLDPELGDTDSYDAFLTTLAKELKVDPMTAEDARKANIITVDLYQWVSDHFDKLDSLLDVSASDKEEEAIRITEMMEGIISGAASDEFYNELMRGKSLTEADDGDEEEFEEVETKEIKEYVAEKAKNDPIWAIAEAHWVEEGFEELDKASRDEQFKMIFDYLNEVEYDFCKDELKNETLTDTEKNMLIQTTINELNSLKISEFEDKFEMLDKCIQKFEDLKITESITEDIDSDEEDFQEIPSDEIIEDDSTISDSEEFNDDKKSLNELPGTGEDTTEVEEDVEEAIDDVKDNITAEDAFAIETSNSSISVLIADEHSAIDGYNSFLNQMRDTLIPSLYEVLEKEIKEIIADEEDHINILNTIKDNFKIDNIPPINESKNLEEDISNLKVGDMVTIPYARGPRYTQDRSEWVKGKILNINPDYTDLEVPTTLTVSTSQLNKWLSKEESKLTEQIITSSGQEFGDMYDDLYDKKLEVDREFGSDYGTIGRSNPNNKYKDKLDKIDKLLDIIASENKGKSDLDDVRVLFDLGTIDQQEELRNLVTESKVVKEDHQLYYDDIQNMSTEERHKLWMTEHDKDFEDTDEGNDMFWDWAEEEFPVKELNEDKNEKVKVEDVITFLDADIDSPYAEASWDEIQEFIDENPNMTAREIAIGYKNYEETGEFNVPEFNIEDAAAKVQQEAEYHYKGSEINADTLDRVARRFFSLEYTEDQLDELQKYFEEQEKKWIASEGGYIEESKSK